MILPPLFPVALLPAGLCLLSLVSATTNHTIDDQDSLFHYSSGDWERIDTNLDSTGGNLDYNGSHRLSLSQTSSANITYTFANVYFLASGWSYPVASNYAIDGNQPMYIDMQDYSVPTTSVGLNGTRPVGVVGKWTSNANQQHTIFITVPTNQTHSYAVIDAFIFEVLDPDSTTTQTSSSTGTMSGPTYSTSSSSSVSPSGTSSASHGPSATEVRELIISMAIVGTLLAFLLVFLLWRFCIRRQNKTKNNGNLESLEPYHPVPNDGIDGDSQNTYASGEAFSTSMRPDPMFISRNSGTVSLSDSSASMRYGGATRHYGGIQSGDSIRKPPIVLNYDPSTSSPRSPVVPLYTQSLPHDPQGHSSTPLMVTDDPPVYTHSSVADESTLSATSNGKPRNFHPYSRTPANTLFVLGNDPDDERTSTTIPGRQEDHDSVWDSGYPQPLKFVPIL